MRKKKLVLVLIYLLCSFGASWHTYQIFQLIVNGELVPTEHYKLINRVPMPVLVFCHQIDEKLIDKNHRLTGNYLEQLTSDMTAERTFTNISYLSESNVWSPLDVTLVKRFFFLNMKCFRIETDQLYHRDQFHFSTESQVLKVNFSDSPYTRKGYVHFMTRSKETSEFSKIISLDFQVIYQFSKMYSLTYETSLYEYEDRFSFIRRHFHFHSFQDTDDLKRLLELQDNEYGLRTLNLPMEPNEFGLEFQEDLFEQLHLIHKNRDKLTNLNYKRLFVGHHLIYTRPRRTECGTEFTFNLRFLQRIVHSTNEENFGMLILSLLNVLSIWFDFGVLDLHPALVFSYDYLLVYLCFHLPVLLFTKVYRFLKKLESSLCEILKPPNSAETSEEISEAS